LNERRTKREREKEEREEGGRIIGGRKDRRVECVFYEIDQSRNTTHNNNKNKEIAHHMHRPVVALFTERQTSQKESLFCISTKLEFVLSFYVFSFFYFFFIFFSFFLFFFLFFSFFFFFFLFFSFFFFFFSPLFPFFSSYLHSIPFISHTSSSHLLSHSNEDNEQLILALTLRTELFNPDTNVKIIGNLIDRGCPTILSLLLS
jgi:hypothetical protein